MLFSKRLIYCGKKKEREIGYLLSDGKLAFGIFLLKLIIIYKLIFMRMPIYVART